MRTKEDSFPPKKWKKSKRKKEKEKQTKKKGGKGKETLFCFIFVVCYLTTASNTSAAKGSPWPTSTSKASPFSWCPPVKILKINSFFSLIFSKKIHDSRDHNKKKKKKENFGKKEDLPWFFNRLFSTNETKWNKISF